MTRALDILESAYQVALAVGVVVVFAATYWVLPDPESRL